MDEATNLKLRGYLLEVLADTENRVRLALDILHEAAIEERFDIVLAAIIDIHHGMALNEQTMAAFIHTDHFYRSMNPVSVSNRGRADYKARLHAVYHYDEDLLRRMMEALGDGT